MLKTNTEEIRQEHYSAGFDPDMDCKDHSPLFHLIGKCLEPLPKPAPSLAEVWVGADRPRCQQGGCIERATVMVGWMANSYWKVFCDQHKDRVPKGYYVAKLVGIDE
jgi:hypothetical protein